MTLRLYKQLEIMRLLAGTGLSGRAIAERVGTSCQTVCQYRRHGPPTQRKRRPKLEPAPTPKPKPKPPAELPTSSCHCTRHNTTTGKHAACDLVLAGWPPCVACAAELRLAKRKRLTTQGRDLALQLKMEHKGRLGKVKAAMLRRLRRAADEQENREKTEGGDTCKKSP